jgi:hypothetical protein
MNQGAIALVADDEDLPADHLAVLDVTVLDVTVLDAVLDDADGDARGTGAETRRATPHEPRSSQLARHRRRRPEFLG